MRGPCQSSLGYEDGKSPVGLPHGGPLPRSVLGGSPETYQTAGLRWGTATSTSTRSGATRNLHKRSQSGRGTPDCSLIPADRATGGVGTPRTPACTRSSRSLATVTKKRPVRVSVNRQSTAPAKAGVIRLITVEGVGAA